jgi:transcriptional regulator with XRE-family HTH domain
VQEGWVVTDQRPRWAQRIQHLRRARSWSQTQAVAALRAVSGKPLPDDVSLLCAWKRWEAGTTRPGGRYRRLISRTVDVEPDVLFAGGEQPLDIVLDPGLLDLIGRIDRSDVDQVAIDRIALAVDQMWSDYSALPPGHLLAETATWLVRIDGLLDRRHSDR